jgi:hypothetical protein
MWQVGELTVALGNRAGNHQYLRYNVTARKALQNGVLVRVATYVAPDFKPSIVYRFLP